MNLSFINELEKIAAYKARHQKRPIRAENLSGKTSVDKSSGHLKTAKGSAGMDAAQTIAQRYFGKLDPRAMDKAVDMLDEVLPAFKRVNQKHVAEATKSGISQGTKSGLRSGRMQGGLAGLGAGSLAGAGAVSALKKEGSKAEVAKGAVSKAVELGKKYWKPAALVAGGATGKQGYDDWKLGRRYRKAQGG